MKRSSLVIAAIGVFGACLLYNSCGKSGIAFKRQDVILTNPFTPTDAGPKILEAICTVLQNCHSGLSRDLCRTGVLKAQGIDYQLGLLPGRFTTLGAILQAEETASILASAATDVCTSGIAALSCSAPEVIKAYDPVLSDPFAAVGELIPTAPGSCPGVFAYPSDHREYFVATGGSDATGDGSLARPWASITHASETLVLGTGGATVHVAPGIYNAPAALPCPHLGGNCSVMTARSGSGGGRLVYVSDIQGAAHLEPSGAFGIWLNSGDFVDIVGFDVKGDSASNFGIYNNGSFVRIIGNEVHGIPVTDGCATRNNGSGIDNDVPGHDSETLANRVYDIGPLRSDGLPATSYCPGAVGIAQNAPRGKIQNNLVYRISGYGIQGWHESSDLQVTHNLVFASGNRTDLGNFSGGGIQIGADTGLNDKTTVANNILRNNSGLAIREQGATGLNNKYLNNLLYQNGMDIMLQNGLTTQGTILADPLQQNFQLDGSGDYRLTAISPAVDAGTLECAGTVTTCTPETDSSGHSRPLGAGLDLGPYEWRP